MLKRDLSEAGASIELQPKKKNYYNDTVHPLTGKPYDGPDAITRAKWLNDRLVNPITGKPSNEPGSIPRHIHYNRTLVDPNTGEPSNRPDADLPRYFQTKLN